MNLKTLCQGAFRRLKRRPVVSALTALAAVALALMLSRTATKPVPAYSYYEVRRGDFLVSIVEGGALEAVNEVVVRNEVEGTARIIYIVPEGTYVAVDDLLVELDSSSTQDAVDAQQLNVERAQFAVKQAESSLEIQKSVEDSNLQAARLRVEFAASDLKKFVEGESLQMRRNAQIEITNVLENLQIDGERLMWSERLYTNGFVTKGDLDRDRLTVNQTKLKREQAQQALWMVETFDLPKRQRELEAARDETMETMERARLQSDRRLSQAQADLESQKSTLELNLIKLKRTRTQLDATKIYAPQEGLVVYASAGGGGRGYSSESMIEEGAVVRNRQELIKLPDISAMKLSVKIHESHINEVHLGQPAYVVLDAMPDQRFAGVVNKVAPLPDSSSRFTNPDLKVYATEILVTDQLPDVKPGVSARVEIIITNLPDVLTVPIQAITTRKGRQVVFLTGAPQEPVPVKVGLYNTKFIEIADGLKPGDQVLLAPPFDTKEKDLGGAIIADGEAAPAAATNRPAPAAASDNEHEALGVNGDRGAAPGGGRRGGPGGLAGMVRQFDLNSDGELDENEFTPLAAALRAGRGSAGLGVWHDLITRFDTDGDSKLDAGELAAALFELASRQRDRGGPAPEPPLKPAP